MIGPAKPSSVWMFCHVCICRGHSLPCRTFFLLWPLAAGGCGLPPEEHSGKNFQIVQWDYSRKEPRWKERWCGISLNYCLTSFRLLVSDLGSWTRPLNHLQVIITTVTTECQALCWAPDLCSSLSSSFLLTFAILPMSKLQLRKLHCPDLLSQWQNQFVRL